MQELFPVPIFNAIVLLKNRIILWRYSNIAEYKER